MVWPKLMNIMIIFSLQISPGLNSIIMETCLGDYSEIMLVPVCCTFANHKDRLKLDYIFL